MGWAETVATVERARAQQPVGFRRPGGPAIGFSRRDPPQAAFPQGYDMPSTGRPRAGENGRSGTARSLACRRSRFPIVSRSASGSVRLAQYLSRSDETATNLSVVLADVEAATHQTFYIIARFHTGELERPRHLVTGK